VLKESPAAAGIDPAFVHHLRGILEALAAGREPSMPAGALGHLLVCIGPTPREAVARLAERWFGPPLRGAESERPVPILNDEKVGEAEKWSTILDSHLGGRRPWTALSTNESTFYRYRRAAFAEFIERCWTELTQRPIPTNRPRPEFDRYIGRQVERGAVLAALSSPSANVVGIEGAGGTGKTALAQVVVSQCLVAARQWQPVEWRPPEAANPVRVPIFDAVVWIGNRQGGLDLGAFLDVVARTLDYPGLLGRELADRRSAIRELLGRQPVLLVVDDADRADPAVLSFLLELPTPARALLTARHRLPPRVAAIALNPLGSDEALALLRAEGDRQSVRGLRLAPDSELRPLADATRRFPLLTVWAAGQLRQGQTIERVQARLERAEGGVFEEMFAGSVQALSDDGRGVLQVLPLFPAPAARAAIVAAAASPDPEGGIDELLEASLLEATEGLTDRERRYSLHPIARAFVRRRWPLDEGAERQALFGLVSHYRDLAETFAGSVRRWASFDRIETEIDNVMSASEAGARVATREGEPPGPAFDHALVGLARGLRNFFWLRHYWREGLEFFHRALESARRLGDTRAVGWNTYSLAYLHYELGTAGYREARVRAGEAVELLRQAADLRGVGHAMRLLGRAARERGDFAAAWKLLEEANAVLEAHGRGDDVMIVRASQADLLRRQGRLAEAADRYLAVLEAGLDDPGTRANVLHNLADVRLRQGALDVAEELFNRGESVARSAGARGLVAECRWGLAQVTLRRGDARTGARLADEAANLFERLGEAERAIEARTVTGSSHP
jgi:tetratricopeptide (TPR) repeat protein